MIFLRFYCFYSFWGHARDTKALSVVWNILSVLLLVKELFWGCCNSLRLLFCVGSSSQVFSCIQLENINASQNSKNRCVSDTNLWRQEISLSNTIFLLFFYFLLFFRGHAQNREIVFSVSFSHTVFDEEANWTKQHFFVLSTALWAHLRFQIKIRSGAFWTAPILNTMQIYFSWQDVNKVCSEIHAVTILGTYMRWRRLCR